MSALLDDYENAAPLPTQFAADGKSLVNPAAPRSPCYDTFPRPIDSSNNGFDFHIYYQLNDEQHVAHARALHQRIRREFPELRIYRFWDRPVGPHPVPMFEVNVFTPHQTGALFAFLVVHRGPCSVLIHPNTGDPVRDHTELATWMGPLVPLDVGILRPH